MDADFTPEPQRGLRLRTIVLGGVVVIAAVAVFVYWDTFGAPAYGAKSEDFIIPQGESIASAVDALAAKGFVKHAWAFDIALKFHGAIGIAPGGYSISKSMNAWKIAGVLASPPPMKWVAIPEGLRKEEIADILQKDLGWSDEAKQEWITVDTAPDADHTEGVYFPDTYLIGVKDTPANIAKRMRTHFDEEFAPYQAEANAQNIKWTTALKLASLIQREAAGASDMPTISGVLWNRLEKRMPLGIDATIQYVKGTEADWWPGLHAGDTNIASPFNTYTHLGLPPQPIDNPGLDAIKAALEPVKTACLYYLHDASGGIHCSATYAQHQKNIETYLK